MKRFSPVLLICVAVIASPLWVQAAEQSPHSTWRAGIAKARITPQRPLWLAGYASRTKPADGKLHDLWVKALAIEDARRQRAVVVTTDLLGFPKPLADSVCDQLEKIYGLQRSQIMLTSSHTHSGPVLEGSLSTVYPMDDQQRERSRQYTGALEQAIVKTVAEAVQHLAPATLSIGMGTCGFAANRRNNVEKDVAKHLAAHELLKGPDDHSVPVLAVQAADGKLMAVLFLYACHNTTLDGYQYSGDYAGFAQLAMEKNHPGATAMFAMGCGADQNPLPRRTVELCEKYGDALAESVETVLARPRKPLVSTLHTEFEIANLPFSGKLKVEQLHAAAANNDYLGRWAQQTLQKMHDLAAQGKELPTAYPYPVQVWRLGGDPLWIALGGEVVVDYALTLKAKYGQDTWVFGYANDVMAYVPSGRVWKEGGYESVAFNVYGIAAERWCPDIEDRIDAVVDHLVRRSRDLP